MGHGETRRGGFLPVLLGLLVLGLLAGAVVQLRDRGDDPPRVLRPVDLGARDAPEPDERASTAASTARSAVEAFYGLDHRTLDADLAEVRELATGEFATEYEAAADQLRDRVLERRLVTTATLVPDGTATSSLSTTRAEVLVCVDVVRRADGGPPERRDYRVVVELARADGAWLVSGLEPVT